MEIKVSKTSTFQSCFWKTKKEEKWKNKKEEDDIQDMGAKNDDKSITFSLLKRAKIELSNNRQQLCFSLGFTLVDLLGASRKDGTYSSINQIPTILSCLGYADSTTKKKSLKAIKIKTHDGRAGYAAII